MSVAERIPAPLAERLQVNPYRHPNRYMDVNGVPVLCETTCKLCGAILTAVGPDPRLTSIQRELRDTNVRTIIRETFVSRLRTAAFDTAELVVEELHELFQPVGDEFKDARAPRFGMHRTSLCTTCKNRLPTFSTDQLQWIFEADLERMAIEDEVNKVRAEHTKEVLQRLSERIVRSLAD